MSGESLFTWNLLVSSFTEWTSSACQTLAPPPPAPHYKGVNDTLFCCCNSNPTILVRTRGASIYFD